MVAGGAQIEPRNAVGHKGVRARPRRHVGRALRHNLPLVGWQNAAAEASLRVRAHLGRSRIGIHRDVCVVGLAAHIAHLKHEVFGELAFHRKAPFLHGGREHVRIETSGLISRAWLRYRWAASGREGDILLEWKVRKEPVRYRDRFASVKGWIGVGAYTEVIHEIVVDSEAGPHRPSSRAGRVPGKAHAWLP